MVGLNNKTTQATTLSFMLFAIIRCTLLQICFPRRKNNRMKILF